MGNESPPLHFIGFCVDLTLFRSTSQPTFLGHGGGGLVILPPMSRLPKNLGHGPNSKLLPYGGSGRKAYFQENLLSRRKFVIARSFLEQSTSFFWQIMGKDNT